MGKAVLVFIGLTLLEGLIAKLAVNKWQRRQYETWGWNPVRVRAVITWFLLTLAVWLSPLYSSRAPVWPGAIISFMGSMLTIWAVRTNPYFVPAIIWLPKYMLVTSGPYRYLRHPGYLGMMIQAIGIATLFNNLVTALCAGLYCLVVLHTTYQEDRLLYPR